MPLPGKISDGDLDLESIEPGLLRLAAESLGNAATPEDGHDAIFSQAVNAFQAGAAESQNLEDTLAPHFVGAVGATSDTLAGETQLLAQNVDAGVAILAEGGDSTTNTPPPAAGRPTRPPPGAPPGGRPGGFRGFLVRE